jgi:hypothetical protein
VSAETKGDNAIHERKRAEIVATIPGWYSPIGHLLVPSLLGLSAMAGALSRIHDLGLVELVTIPLTLFFAFGFEWRVHQLLLHRRTPGASVLYERHELMHHVIYTYDDMAMRSSRELRLILMPAFAVVGVLFVNLPFTIAIAALVSKNAACLFLATSMIFFLTYEWLHCAYHLPKDSAIGRNGIISYLREHHRRHHDPRLMKNWNFNVTVPVFDWIHRSTWTPEREAERAEKAARRAAARRAAAHG